MEETTLSSLFLAAATVGVVHTVLGPDHYVPFVALARSRRWTVGRTLAVTLTCGIGHVIGSIALGLVGIALGWALGHMVSIETWRGDAAGWLLLGLGVAYTAWGIRRALRGAASHSHVHGHADGTLHHHAHDHRAAHLHPHLRPGEEPARRGLARWLAAPGGALGPWTLFVIFALGPCEPLIPLLMVPAAQHAYWAAGAIALVFALATLATMAAVVLAGSLGLSLLPAPAPSLERWSHALAGAALVACGLAIQWGL